MTGTLVVENIGTLATMTSTTADPLGRISDAVVVIRDGVIVYAGTKSGAPATGDDDDRCDARGCTVLPGLIDCHTHLIWAGTRIDEHEQRSRGATYAEIMAAGGGIRSTMRAVRETSTEDLTGLARFRVDQMLARGVTTIEMKSGYGLNVDDEIRSLYAMRRLALDGSVDVVSTCLAAHAVPPEFEGDKDGYVSLIVDELLPRVKEENLASFVDVFVENGAFSVDDGRRILTKARDLGLKTRVHAEQLSRHGGARLAAEMGATAAGHLEFVDDGDMRALADAGVVCEILAAAQVFLGLQQRIPGRALKDAGCVLAVGTDANPGSAPMLDLHLAASLAVSMAGLSTDDALLGVTKNAARALALDDRGEISVGKIGDLVVIDGTSPVRLLSQWGENPVRTVVKAGWPVHAR